MQVEHSYYQALYDARDFRRVLIHTGSLTLKVDFVADRVPRVGLPQQRHRIIAEHYQFSWKQVLEDAAQKAIVSAEEIAYRLKSFPSALIDEVPFAKPPDATRVQTAIATLAEELQDGGENSLCAPDAEGL